MRNPRPTLLLTILLSLTLSLPAALEAQSPLTSPEEALGFRVGADYHLADYTQLMAWWEVLARESDRMTLEVIGRSEQGRPQVMAIITSPDNHRALDKYRSMSRRLAKAEGVGEEEARRLAEEGRAVVWIDGGLHATEVLAAQQLMETVWQLVSREDAETLRILDDVVVLAVHANPDGHELVADWYMRAEEPSERTTSGIPVLYQEYAGHDNNRDFYMSNLAETTNMNRVLYRTWFPQIVYNHHQTGPAGTIMFAPPFRDPPNHNLDPLIITSIEQVGSAMHGRFVAEGKGGTTMRSGASYSTWWNGGLRTTPYFKNMIGLLTETIGHPTPMEVPFLPRRQISSNDLPLPVEPGTWHFRQSIEYSVTANYAVLDYASRNREHLLFNIWRMGMNSIERGSRDSWTVLPSEIDAAREQMEGRRGDREDYERLLRRPEDREARGYILPSDQGDFPTATKFVNALLINGVDVHRAEADFTVEGTRYPAGSYVVKTAQAFRPHVLDMFEPQDHPDDFAYPGAPPTPPYDNAGWTLAYQMGVDFDRILDAFDGPFQPIQGKASVPAGEVSGPSRPAGWLFSHVPRDAFTAVNRLTEAGCPVYWLTGDFSQEGRTWPAGTFYAPAGDGAEEIVRETAQGLGIDFAGTARSPSAQALRLRPPRIGLWDRYGGSMDSGWIRFILDSFEFPYEQVFAPRLDRGGLAEDFDVLIFPDGAIPSPDRGTRSSRRGTPDLSAIPAEYRDRVGRVTGEETVPQILEFLREGGTVITIGSSTALAYHTDLPLSDHLVDPETGEPLPSEEYYVPGSVLELKLEHRSPLTHGMGERLDVLFSRSPVFRVPQGSEEVVISGWFDQADPLRSGWAWGQHHLEGGVAVAEAQVGEGRLFLFGPEVTFRGQSHAALGLFFNGIHYGASRPGTIRR
ncbi:MAG: M14 family metallopeptidase [bacterium]